MKYHVVPASVVLQRAGKSWLTAYTRYTIKSESQAYGRFPLSAQDVPAPGESSVGAYRLCIETGTPDLRSGRAAQTLQTALDEQKVESHVRRALDSIGLGLDKWRARRRMVLVAVWPSGTDWDLPFTLAGCIIWPERMVQPSLNDASLHVLVHETLHVAQHDTYADACLGSALRLGGFWDSMLAVEKQYAWHHLPPRRSWDDWYTDCAADQNAKRLLKFTISDAGEVGQGGTNTKMGWLWWDCAVRNPDNMEQWFCVQLRDGRWFLPWMVRRPYRSKSQFRSAAGRRNLDTIFLPIRWRKTVSQYPVVIDEDDLSTESDRVFLSTHRQTILSHFGKISQCDHPHEMHVHSLIARISHNN